METPGIFPQNRKSKLQPTSKATHQSLAVFWIILASYFYNYSAILGRWFSKKGDAIFQLLFPMNQSLSGHFRNRKRSEPVTWLSKAISQQSIIRPSPKFQAKGEKKTDI
jgi:hypothetical protein